MNRLKGLVYDAILQLATLGIRRKKHSRKLLVVRVDEIGDFMLWHKFLPGLLNAYPGYEYHFCGNQSWRSLFETLHPGVMNKTLWLDKLRFKKDMPYRFRFLKQVFQEDYDTVINPTFSRDKRYDDSIVRAAKAIQRIGMNANLEAIRSYETGYDKDLYTRLFDHPEKPLFEFYRNRLFAAFVSGNTSAVTDTRIEKHLAPILVFPLPEVFFVIFPGSRSSKRIWPAENFIRVANHLHQHYGWTAVVCGTKADTVYTQAFLNGYKNPALDLTGQTSLPQMLSLFGRAECLISVDTGSVHLATSMGCAVFGVFNGSQYGRFSPYPKQLAPGFYAVYPDEIEKDLQDEDIVRQRYEFVVDIPYSHVKPEKMILALHQHFQ